METFVISAGLVAVFMLINNLIIDRRFRRIEQQIDAQLELNGATVEALRGIFDLQRRR